jgi:hypothetical protein
MYNGIDEIKYAPIIIKLNEQLKQLIEKYDDLGAIDILKKVK